MKFRIDPWLELALAALAAVLVSYFGEPTSPRGQASNDGASCEAASRAELATAPSGLAAAADSVPN